MNTEHVNNEGTPSHNGLPKLSQLAGNSGLHIYHIFPRIGREMLGNFLP